MIFDTKTKTNQSKYKEVKKTIIIFRYKKENDYIRRNGSRKREEMILLSIKNIKMQKNC